MKIIIGAAETWQKGWYATNEQWLDVAKESDWDNIFRNKKNLTNIVAEHVFEHLTHEECQIALKQIFNHMDAGGQIRIAVPDGYHPDPEYLRHVQVSGAGADAADHKQLLTVDMLFELLRNAGFTPRHIEGYTSNGDLIEKKYSIEDGYINRSRANKRGIPEADGWSFVDSRTSLIVDGVIE